MKMLWFKGALVADILVRRKTDTIRKRSARLPVVGEMVGLSVGPRAPFATAQIVAVEDVRDLPPDRAAQAAELGIDLAGDLVRIEFRVNRET
jgi:hypothetical protein